MKGCPKIFTSSNYQRPDIVKDCVASIWDSAFKSDRAPTTATTDSSKQFKKQLRSLTAVDSQNQLLLSKSNENRCKINSGRIFGPPAPLTIQKLIYAHKAFLAIAIMNVAEPEWIFVRFRSKERLRTRSVSQTPNHNRVERRYARC